MGRSVSHPSGAIVAFRDCSGEPCDECKGAGSVDAAGDDPDQDPDICLECNGTGWIDGVTDWDEEISYYRDRIREVFPSFTSCDTWLDREDHAIAENGFAYFGISEYCGLVAIWLVGKEHGDHTLIALSDRWLQQVEKRFLASFGEFRKVGTMSNGEGVYQRT